MRTKIEKIVAAAVTAPSGDNCQPFEFFLKEESILEIHHIENRGRHELNCANHSSLITVGCILELIQIQAEALGLATETQLADGIGSSQKSLWASVVFTESCVKESALLKAIPFRATDRRHFRGGDLSDSVFTEIKLEVRQFGTTSLHTLPARGELLDFILKCESFMWDHPRPTKDFLSWVRFTLGERNRTRDGMYWTNLGINWFDAQLLLSVKKWPVLRQFIFGMGGGVIARATLRKQLQSSAGILFFTTEDTSSRGILQLGRASIRAWLRLINAGYGVQPLSLSSLALFDFMTQCFPKDVKPEYCTLYSSGKEIWQNAAEVGAPALPIWAWRVGKSASLPKDVRTLRKNVPEILKFSTPL